MTARFWSSDSDKLAEKRSEDECLGLPTDEMKMYRITKRKNNAICVLKCRVAIGAYLTFTAWQTLIGLIRQPLYRPIGPTQAYSELTYMTGSQAVVERPSVPSPTQIKTISRNECKEAISQAAVCRPRPTGADKTIFISSIVL